MTTSLLERALVEGMRDAVFIPGFWMERRLGKPVFVALWLARQRSEIGRMSELGHRQPLQLRKELELLQPQEGEAMKRAV